MKKVSCWMLVPLSQLFLRGVAKLRVLRVGDLQGVWIHVKIDLRASYGWEFDLHVPRISTYTKELQECSRLRLTLKNNWIGFGFYLKLFP